MAYSHIATTAQWSKRRYYDVLEQLREYGRPGAVTMIGVDGHSGSGKSTLADGLAGRAKDVCVVHSDDLAWHHSFFGWDELLIDNILKPLRDVGPPVSYRPEAWVLRDRPGSIIVPADTAVVIFEGVGVCSQRLESWFDATVWVHARPEVGRRRVISKGADSEQFADDWMAQENSFLTDNQPWRRADLLVAGELGQPSRRGEFGNVVTGPGPGRPSAN